MSSFNLPSFLTLRSLQPMSPYLASAYSPLKHPSHPTISDLNCNLQAKLYQQQAKDELLSHHTACLPPPHPSYSAIVLANDRAQCSVFRHEEHLHLSFLGCLASGEHSDATIVKSLTRSTEVHKQVDLFPVLNHFPTACRMKKDFGTGPSERIFCGIVWLLRHSP